jgi:pilus assembly protein CpaB
MRAKSMVLILIALGCGLVASIAISQVMERGSKSANAGLETVPIYVASTDIDVNEQLSATNVRVEEWPKSKLPEGVVKDLKDINERFARVRFYAGEPILAAKLVNEIEGPAVKIPDGHRVCSMKVQMDTAIAGLVNPGDRVDIFGYFKEGRGIPKTGTREILKNVRVFAVNDQTDQEVDQQGQSIAAKTVSLLVKQDQVARLMLAIELGTMRLALRRPNEESDSTNVNESADIDALFGSRSETADTDGTQALTTGTTNGQFASAAQGFVGFLNNLKSQKNDNQVPEEVTTVDPAPRRPVWQMTLLTPEGGTQFTWDDEQSLPIAGDTMGAGPAPATRPTQPAPPVNTDPPTTPAWPPTVPEPIDQSDLTSNLNNQEMDEKD